MTKLKKALQCEQYSINGSVAIQLELSKFDPSQNPNHLTDYD